MKVDENRGFVIHVCMVDRNGVNRSILRCRSYNYAMNKLRQFRMFYPRRIYSLEFRT